MQVQRGVEMSGVRLQAAGARAASAAACPLWRDQSSLNPLEPSPCLHTPGHRPRSPLFTAVGDVVIFRVLSYVRWPPLECPAVLFVSVCSMYQVLKVLGLRH